MTINFTLIILCWHQHNLLNYLVVVDDATFLKEEFTDSCTLFDVTSYTAEVNGRR